MDRQQAWDKALRALAEHGVEPSEPLLRAVADDLFSGAAPFREPPTAYALAAHFLRKIAALVLTSLDRTGTVSRP